MTTETQAQTQTPPQPSTAEERMARIEAQQEIIIELLKGQDVKIDALDKKFDTKIDALDKKFDTKIDALDKKFDTKIDTVNSRIDTTNHRIFLAGLGLFTIVGAGVVTYVVNLLT